MNKNKSDRFFSEIINSKTVEQHLNNTKKLLFLYIFIPINNIFQKQKQNKDFLYIKV